MINSESISLHFDLVHSGGVQKVISYGSLKSQGKNKILWAKNLETAQSIKSGIVVIPSSLKDLLNPSEDLTFLFTEKSPRLIFAKILNSYFKDKILNEFTNCINDHKKNKNIQIGENCFIGPNVKIGDGTIILHNTSIFGNTVIGKNCHINTNCSLSTTGLGFEYDGDEIIKFPQLGGVMIGDNVEIGPNSTIRRGALDQTIIGDDTKIGSLSNVGHNCIVGKQCILTSQIILGGSSVVGNRVFIGMGTSIKNKVEIGNDVTIGMGSVVIKNVASDLVVAGNPAKVLKSK